MRGPSTLQVVARLPFASVDALEAGFADRIGESSLFLPQAAFAPSVVLSVGSIIHVDVQLQGGELALRVEGVVAWAYPIDRVPPGREAGAGIVIDRVDEAYRARVMRMRARSSAGARLKMPGTKIGRGPLDAMRAAARAPTPQKRPLPKALLVDEPSGGQKRSVAADAAMQNTSTDTEPYLVPVAVTAPLLDATTLSLPLPNTIEPVVLDPAHLVPLPSQESASLQPAEASDEDTRVARSQEGRAPGFSAEARSEENHPFDDELEVISDVEELRDDVVGAGEAVTRTGELLQPSLRVGQFIARQAEPERTVPPGVDLPPPVHLGRVEPLPLEKLEKSVAVEKSGETAAEWEERTMTDARPLTRHPTTLEQSSSAAGVTAIETGETGTSSSAAIFVRPLPPPEGWPSTRRAGPPDLVGKTFAATARVAGGIDAVVAFAWPVEGTRRPIVVDTTRLETEDHGAPVDDANDFEDDSYPAPPLALRAVPHDGALEDDELQHAESVVESFEGNTAATVALLDSLDSSDAVSIELSADDAPISSIDDDVTAFDSVASLPPAPPQGRADAFGRSDSGAVTLSRPIRGEALSAPPPELSGAMLPAFDDDDLGDVEVVDPLDAGAAPPDGALGRRLARLFRRK